MPSHTDEPGPHLTNDRADAPPMPPPVVALLSRAHRESAAFPRHHCVYLAVEASIRLAVAARRWPARGEVETRARSIQHPSVGTWVQLLIAALADAAKAGERGDIDLAFLENDDVVRAVDHLDGPEVDTKRVRNVVQLLQALPTHRNRNFGHGGVRSDAYHDESTRHLERILRESWNAGVFWPRGWTLEGASATEGRQDVVVRSGDAAMPLSPLVVVKGNRWFFLNRRTSRPNGKRARVTYLDYLSDAEDSYRAADELEPEDEGAALLGGVADLLGEAPTEKHTLTGAARYQIHQTLGAGGMGRVLLAFDRLEEKLVALKYPAIREDDAEVKHRLDREGVLLERLAKLGLPGVVRYLDRFDERGPVLVMEHVDGCTISRLGAALDSGVSFDDAFAEASRTNGAPDRDVASEPRTWSRGTLAQYLGLLTEAARTLGAIHKEKILHNDLKQANLMVRNVDQKLEPVWIDFGIGKALDADTRLTGMAGTPSFFAPEARHGTWSALSDIYSFGAILKQELNTRGHRIATLTPAERSNLEKLVNRCEDHYPAQRPQSARELAETLGAIASGKFASEEKQRKRARWVVGALGVAASFATVVLTRDKWSNWLEAPASPTASTVDAARLDAAPGATTATSTESPADTAPATASPGSSARGEAKALSDNCKDWLEGAAVQQFRGNFGSEMKRIAEQIAMRTLRARDLSRETSDLPCVNESDAAWDAYVNAAMSESSVNAWAQNTNLLVSRRLKDALAEKHRTAGWPANKESQTAIRSASEKLVEKAQRGTTIDGTAADAGCEFARSVGLERNLCKTWLVMRKIP